MSKSPPALLEPEVAGKLLQKALVAPKTPLTVADAAAKSGLALRDAERGLHWLSAEYRGALRVTDQGELLFVFPHGFTQPWVTRDAMSRFFTKAGRALAGVGRFVVRAWLTVVLLAYVAVFLAVVIGLTVAQSNNNNRRSSGFGGGLVYVVLRVLADALFWTFHPFSPFAYRSYGYGYQRQESSWGTPARQAKKDDIPFYEKVNRFFFGPTQPEVDPREQERRILAEIRASKGRVGLADVMRVTGLPREQVDPMMARLMVDYDGDVSVSSEGGITYHFEALRKTAEESATDASPEPAWTRTPPLPPLTGNEGGTNFLIVLLNGFNLVMSLYALGNNITIAKLFQIGGKIPIDQLPYDGVPIVLGIVPLVFSAALFLIPIVRAARRPSRAKKLAKERGRLALLRVVLNKIGEKKPINEPELQTAYRKASGLEPDDKEMTRELVRLGGDVEIGAEGRVRYRFADLETEAAALEAEREAAEDQEKKPGKVVFSSDE